MTQLYDPHAEWAREDAETRTVPRWTVEKILQAIATGNLVAPDQKTWETTATQVQLDGRDITQTELRAIWELVEGQFATWGDDPITLTPSGEQWLTRLTALAPYATASGARSHHIKNGVQS